jgi:hypothetical protein
MQTLYGSCPWSSSWWLAALYFWNSSYGMPSIGITEHAIHLVPYWVPTASTAVDPRKNRLLPRETGLQERQQRPPWRLTHHWITSYYFLCWIWGNKEYTKDAHWVADWWHIGDRWTEVYWTHTLSPSESIPCSMTNTYEAICIDKIVEGYVRSVFDWS